MKFVISFLYSSLFFLSLAISTVSWSAPAPEDFGKLPVIYDAAISPDGNRLAVFQNINGIYALRIINMDGRASSKKITPLEKGVKPNWIKWVNNDQVLAGIRQNQKLYGTPVTTGFIYSFDANTYKGKFLIKPSKIVRQYNDNVVDFMEDDPEYILMSFSDENVIQPDIKKVNVVTGRYSTVIRGRYGIQEWYTDLNGTPRIGQGLKKEKKEDWRLIITMPNSEDWVSYEEFPGLKPNADIYGFTRDPNELIIGDRAGKDTMGLYVYDLSQKRRTRTLFHNEDYDVTGVVLSADGKDVIGATYIADDKETELFSNESSGLTKLQQKLPGNSIDYIDQSSDSTHVLVKVSNPSDPGSLMMLNTSTDELSLLGNYYDTISAKDLGEVVSLKYTARDGTKIPAYVTLPPSITNSSQLKKLPFIILPHGGPYARSSLRFDYFSQFFASRGYGVLQMNFRGSSGYGKSYTDAGRKNWVVMQEDVEDGTRWLLEKGYADPNRICIAGWSYGGYAALMGAVKHSDLYKCAISMAGVTDLNDLVRDLQKYRFGAIRAKNTILDGFDGKEDLKENSPVRRADEINIPVFLAHGTADQRVHYDQFTRMKRALGNNPAKVTYMSFKDEDHYLSHEENRIEFFKGLNRFLNETLGPSEFMVK